VTQDNRGGIGRREFLVGGVATTTATLTLGLPEPAWSAPADPRVRRYRPLGRTGLEISDVSFGSSRGTDPSLARYAFDRGVNYFDTAESYKGGGSEVSLGTGLKGLREKVILASKVKCGTDSTKAELMSSLEGSLRRLETDRIEIYFNHAVNDVDRLKNSEWFEFVDLAKQQGKIRFTGISGHGGMLVPSLDYAIDNDLIDVMLVGYNYGQDPSFFQRFTSTLDFVAVQPDLPRVLAKAKKKNLGVVAMKTLRGGSLNDMTPYQKDGASDRQAALRWTLSNPDVSALVISMTSKALIDEYLAASGAPPPTAAELDRLESQLLASRERYCNHGCRLCESSCPEVDIAEVLRTRMYATDYGDLPYARDEYAALERDASPCVTCAEPTCLNACPVGLSISGLTRTAHSLLS